ncbi:hypothetical protein RIF29_40292 [Crotalaria pallida]|uniref:PH domain-containing protein n=1 Tax=Crotalaria pallida TaxID=3830 RepID=A0AAN9HQJ8_CROPI
MGYGFFHWCICQAENEADRTDWVNKITGAITSILNFQFLKQPHYGILHLENKNSAVSLASQLEDSNRSLMDDIYSNEVDSVSKILRGIPGNDKCEIYHIRCYGFGTCFYIFRNLGNAYCNSMFEGLLLLDDERVAESNVPMKPCSTDAFQCKEKYIQAKQMRLLISIQQMHLLDFKCLKAGLLQNDTPHEKKKRFCTINLSFTIGLDESAVAGTAFISQQSPLLTTTSVANSSKNDVVWFIGAEFLNL